MSEVTMEKKETMREKVKGFYQKHELGFVQLGAYVAGLVVIGAGCWLGGHVCDRQNGIRIKKNVRRKSGTRKRFSEHDQAA